MGHLCLGFLTFLLSPSLPRSISPHCNTYLAPSASTLTLFIRLRHQFPILHCTSPALTSVVATLSAQSNHACLSPFRFPI
ncbi:hypothetical protein BKA57DRAFT_474419 [Linnemannia elongata]|nr:hypothetical protein BKA57DRAFT_474419 [Linnemannia elongata]